MEYNKKDILKILEHFQDREGFEDFKKSIMYAYETFNDKDFNHYIKELRKAF